LGNPLPNVTINFVVTQGTTSLSAASATTNGAGFASVTANLTNLSVNVQISACVAPSNSQCTQPFVLNATPASSWTLQTVSGSPQVILTGQAFQPLDMRVTDGSSAANPVMGVNVAFATTLALVNGDGPPVLLGSSQSQAVSAQDGTASIVPSAGNVGPCAVFITVSAGPSTAQLQMQSLAAIAPVQPDIPGKVAPVESEPHFGSGRSPESQALPMELFAVPQAAPSNDPTVESHPNMCAEPSADEASINPGTSATSSPANESSASPPPCEKPKPVEAKAKTPERPAPADKHVVSTPSSEVPTPVEFQPNPSSTIWLHEDKRSCRALADDSLIL
jgi:hypothetical protein